MTAEFCSFPGCIRQLVPGTGPRCLEHKRVRTKTRIAVAALLREGYGVEDIAVTGVATLEESRAVVAEMRDGGLI